MKGLIAGILVFLVCGLTATPSPADTQSAEADFVPWSGFWWPTRGGGLANGYGEWGHPAPIEKYEWLTIGWYPEQATAWELENYYDPDAPSWYGQCHAWAAAAASEDIAFFPSSYENIIFRVGDKKGLLSACHGSDPAIHATGDDGPHVFHQWLLLYIKENGKPFVADLGVPSEAWFYPIYQYELQTSQSNNTEHVYCRIWYADDRVDPDFQGTQVKTDVYTYDLFLGAEGEITGGEWTGSSLYSHPESMFFPLSPEPTNPYLEYETIKDIAVHQDDFLEDDATVRLLPGAYNLILLDQDVYTIECETGDAILLDVARLDDFQEGIEMRLQDAGGAVVLEEILQDDMSLSILAENPPYTLLLDRDDYGGGGIYTVQLDLKKAHEFLCPHLQPGAGWDGFALTNTTTLPCDDIHVVAYDQANTPVATIMGPLTLHPGERKAFCLSDLSIRIHERPSIFFVKIMANEGLSVLYLGETGRQSMLGFGMGRRGERIVLPDTSSMFNAGKHVWWGIYNGAVEPILANLWLYARGGALQEETTLYLPGNSLNRYTSSNNPFNTDTDDGWIMIEGDGQGEIEGYVRWSMDASGRAESMFALSSLGTCFFVPHVAETTPWSTEVTIINVSDMENEVSLNLVDGAEAHDVSFSLFPFEKARLRVADVFLFVDGETLTRSALIITSQREVTGYFSYETGSSSAYYPLATEEDTATDLLIPHVASDSLWWTGVGIFNPTYEESEVRLIPYNREGVRITEAIKAFTLEWHKKRTFTIYQLFGGSLAGEISWVEVQAAGQGVCGLFLYGNKEVDIISGSSLYWVESW